MSQSEKYKNVEVVDYVGGIVGGDKAADQLKISIVDSEHAPTVDVEDRNGRSLGSVSVAELPEPVTTDLADALASQANDSVQVKLSGDDVGVATEETLNALTAALVSNGGDSLQVALQADNAGLATQNTLSALAAALQSNDNDALVVSHDGVIDVSSRDGRNLGSVDVSTLPDADYAEAWQATLAADGTNSYAVSAIGADALDGRVKAEATHDVTVEWQDSSGNVVESVEVATGVAAGTWTDLGGLTPKTPHAVVKVTDTSSAETTASAGVHLH